MCVGVPYQHRGVAQRRIERVIGGFWSVIVTATMLDRDFDSEFMGFWNLLDRFPIGSPVPELKHLARAVGTNGAHLDRAGGDAGRAEARRDTGLVDRKLQFAMTDRDSLELRPVVSSFA